MSDTRVREAIPADIDQIIELIHEHMEYEGAAINKTMGGKALSFHLFSAKTITCLVAEHDSKIVGYATFMQQFSTWEAGFYLYVDCLYMKETARGRGTGKKMMQVIINRAKTMNCLEIQWQTPSFNKQAIGFYRHLGATSLNKERFFFPNHSSI